MPVTLLLALLTSTATRTRHSLHRLRSGEDQGAFTLEAVILILGLIALAALLVTALTVAVQRRVDQIN